MSKYINTFRQLFFSVTLLLAAFPIWPIRWAAYLIILWSVCALLAGLAEPNRSWQKNAGLLGLFSSIFLIHVTSYFLTETPPGSYQYLERRLSLLVVPLGFYLNANGFKEKQVKQILQVFEYAALLVVLYIAFDVVPQVIKHWDNIQAGTGFNWVFRHRVEKLTNIHPTYLSIILLFAIFLKLERFVRKEVSNSFVVLLSESIQVILMLSCCLFLSARGPLIAFAFALVIFFFQINWKRALIGLALGLPVVVILFSSVPAISSRFQELAELNQAPEEGESLNSTQIRQGIFNCSVEVLEKHWVFGVGLGNVQKELNECYDRLNEPMFREMEYNSHNQFLHIWISAGLLGIFVFIISLLYSLYLSYKYRDTVYLFFIILFSVCFLTENLLARQHGVVMFTFFNGLLAFHLVNRKD